MVFYWSLSDSKSPQVSRTFLSIFVNLNNAVVWMVSTCPLISNSSSPFTNPLVIVLSALITIGIIITFMFFCFFSSLVRSRYLSLFLLSFNFTLWSARTAKSTIRQVLFFLLTITTSSFLAKIRWSVCISKSLISLCLILQGGFWVVHIPFICMIKFKLLAQFPVDNLAHPIVSGLILSLCLFTAFAYVINCFVSITTQSTSAILQHFVYFCFHIVLIVLCCSQEIFNFSLMVSLSYPCPSFFIWDFSCLSLQMTIQLFNFLFLFPGNFCSVDACVICIVSGGCNQSSSVLFM